MWKWINTNAAALAVVVGFTGAVAGSVWVVGTTLAGFSTTEQVQSLEDDIEGLEDDIAEVAIDVAAVNGKVDSIQGMLPLMMACIVDQNRNAFAALRAGGTPEEPAGCGIVRVTAEALAVEQAR